MMLIEEFRIPLFYLENLERRFSPGAPKDQLPPVLSCWCSLSTCRSCLLVSTLPMGNTICSPWYCQNLLFSVWLTYLFFLSILAYLSWNRGGEIGANQASLYINLLPPFTALLAVFLLEERFQLYHIAGIFQIFSGLLLFNLPLQRKNWTIEP